MTEDREWLERSIATRLAEILTWWACTVFNISRKEAGSVIYRKEFLKHEVKSGLVSVHLHRNQPGPSGSILPSFTVDAQVYSCVQMEVMRVRSEFGNVCHGRNAEEMADNLIGHFELFLVKGMWDVTDPSRFEAATRTQLFFRLLRGTDGDLSKAMGWLAPSVEDEKPMELAKASVARWFVDHYEEYEEKLSEQNLVTPSPYNPFFSRFI